MNRLSQEIIKLTEFVKEARGGTPTSNIILTRDDEFGDLCCAVNELVIEHSQAFNMWKKRMAEITEINLQAIRFQEAILLLSEIEDSIYEGHDAKTYFSKVIEIVADVMNARYGMIIIFGEDGGRKEFVSTGMDSQIIEKIGHSPQGKGLLSIVYNTDQTLRIDNLENHPASVGFPEGHPIMDSLLCAPIKVNGIVRATIYLSGKRSNTFFTTNDEAVIQNFTDHITHVFERSSLVTIIAETNRSLMVEQDEQKSLIKKLQEAQNQLLQSEKLASIGQLAAGVAHEINNPVGYINSNISSFSNYMEDLFELLDAYVAIDPGQMEVETRNKIQRLRKKIDVVFLKEDIAELVVETQEGVSRVKQIVQDLKDFSHVDDTEWQIVDIHAGLDSTLNVVHSEIKYNAQVIKTYGDLPEIECLPSQINQVFMNLLVNAAHAIEGSGTITIRTGVQNDNGVWVEIADTGKGIKPENITKLFDPFFTTKPVGQGTGLGLSLSYGIVEKHGGLIDVESEEGKGTRFTVRLPVRQTEIDKLINIAN